MARRVPITVEVDGEEREEWIDLSSGVEKAAMTIAWENGMTPPEALSELTGIDAEMFEQNDDEETDEEGQEAE